MRGAGAVLCCLAAAEGRHAVLRFHPSARPEGSHTLSEHLGGVHVAAAGPGSFLVYSDRPSEELHRLPGLVSVQPARHPVHPDVERLGGREEGNASLLVTVSDEPDVRRWRELLRARAIDASLDVVVPVRRRGAHRTGRVLVRTLSPGRAARVLAAQPAVRWIEPAEQRRVDFQNSIATSALQTERGDGSHPLWSAGLRGQGEVVLVGDTGLDYDMCFFRDEAEKVAFWPDVNREHRKILSYIQCIDHVNQAGDHADEPLGHGTHVTGSIAGQAIPGTTTRKGEASQWNGLAPDSKVVFADLQCAGHDLITDLWDLREYYTPGYASGARVCHNSWGGPWSPTVYEAIDVETDEFAFRNQDFLIVYAAGNSGSVLSPAASKNVVSVGSHRNSKLSSERNRLGGSNARGPTWDGRTKPELLAPGEGVTSAQSDGKIGSNQCLVTTKSGTSMAAPWVSGAAILLRQYLREGRYPTGAPAANDSFVPSSSLLKAMLVHAAQPIPGLSTQDSGWGRLVLPHVVHLDTQREPHFLLYNNRSIKHRDVFTVCFRVSGGSAPIPGIRATLVWIDAPGVEGAKSALVNDLDLALVDPLGVVRHGNGGRTWDRVNTVERVDLPLREGVWRAYVHGWEITDHSPYQQGLPFSLVVSAAGIEEVDCDLTGMECPGLCSGPSNGLCVNGTCRCNQGWAGIDCKECDSCSGHGTCTVAGTIRECKCYDHWQGEFCTDCVAGRYGADCETDCTCSGHGTCVKSECSCRGHWSGPECATCARGWTGAECSHPASWCEHEQVVSVTGSSGSIVISGDPYYGVSLWCRWLISAPGGDAVKLDFSAIDTERDPCCNKECGPTDGCDWLIVRDGGADGDIILRVSGKRGPTSVRTASSVAFVEFTSDFFQEGNYTGFTATYRVVGGHPERGLAVLLAAAVLVGLVSYCGIRQVSRSAARESLKAAVEDAFPNETVLEDPVAETVPQSAKGSTLPPSQRVEL
eukprot:TRINITY_DN21250_c0_g1_i1.p1 TRINITY_DN21250_c0_g1~~TRINITY_DN21250_c0_g1_i1.p1  ORF type:complete len:1000 (+),score=208.33 TRINITY_DN21250_c0_g1_i1:58-3000(+)